MGRQVIQRLTVKENTALGRTVGAQGGLQLTEESGLAAAGGAAEDPELALTDRKGHIRQRGAGLLGVGEAKMLQTQQFRHGCPSFPGKIAAPGQGIQQHRRKAQQTVNGEKADRQRRDGAADQHGIILKAQAAGQTAAQQIQAAEGQPEGDGTVTPVKAVEGEGGPPRQAIAPAAHTVGGNEAAFQAPGDNDGEHTKGASDAPDRGAGLGITAQMTLGLRHGTEPPDKAGHKAEDHAQQQGQRRDNAAKEVHHLV